MRSITKHNLYERLRLTKVCHDKMTATTFGILSSRNSIFVLGMTATTSTKKHDDKLRINYSLSLISSHSCDSDVDRMQFYSVLETLFLEIDRMNSVKTTPETAVVKGKFSSTPYSLREPCQSKSYTMESVAKELSFVLPSETLIKGYKIPPLPITSDEQLNEIILHNHVFLFKGEDNIEEVEQSCIGGDQGLLFLIYGVMVFARKNEDDSMVNDASNQFGGENNEGDDEDDEDDEDYKDNDDNNNEENASKKRKTEEKTYQTRSVSKTQQRVIFENGNEFVKCCLTGSAYPENEELMNYLAEIFPRSLLNY